MTTINKQGGAIELDTKEYLDEIYLYEGKEKETLIDYIEHVIVDKVYVYFDDEKEIIVTGNNVRGLGINVKVNDEQQSTKTVQINSITEAKQLINIAFDGKRDKLTIMGLIIEYEKDGNDTSFDYITVIQN